VKDPTRIREAGSDVPDDLRDLFRVAKRPEPLTPDAEAALSARVAAISVARASLIAKRLPFLLGATLVGAGVFGVRAFGPKSERSTAHEPALKAPAASPSAVAVPLPTLRDFTEAPLASSEPPAPVRARVRVPAPTAAAPSASNAGEDALSGEAQLLNEAHRALASNPDQALAIAREHARRYPRGQLAAERELILVQALVKLGRVREAEARGRELRKTAPKSIYEERLDKILRGP